MLLNDRKLLLMLDTAEETVERRLSIAEDTVDLRLDMLLEVLLEMARYGIDRLLYACWDRFSPAAALTAASL